MELGKNFIVHSNPCLTSQSTFREELYFNIGYFGQSKIKDLRPLQGKTLLFVNRLLIGNNKVLT
jgi:hypothetical protein